MILLFSESLKSKYLRVKTAILQSSFKLVITLLKTIIIFLEVLLS